jgi:hypothetical protein
MIPQINWRDPCLKMSTEKLKKKAIHNFLQLSGVSVTVLEKSARRKMRGDWPWVCVVQREGVANLGATRPQQPQPPQQTWSSEAWVHHRREHGGARECHRWGCIWMHGTWWQCSNQTCNKMFHISNTALIPAWEIHISQN